MQTEKLKDLLTKITQGELRIVTNYTGLGVEKIIEGGNQIEICVLRGYNYTGDTEEKTDQEFAANAELISLAPQLAKRVIELEEVMREVDAWVKPHDERTEKIISKISNLLNQ